jgi:hypothetical protein
MWQHPTPPCFYWLNNYCWTRIGGGGWREKNIMKIEKVVMNFTYFTFPSQKIFYEICISLWNLSFETKLNFSISSCDIHKINKIFSHLGRENDTLDMITRRMRSVMKFPHSILHKYFSCLCCSMITTLNNWWRYEEFGWAVIKKTKLSWCTLNLTFED